jgi:glycerol dehydrogenase-like iron-containing ADH family enzyme
MVVKPTFGNWLSVEILNLLDDYILFAMEEPWQIIKPKLEQFPKNIQFNFDMSLNNLQKLAESELSSIEKSSTIIGLGGGSSCDTAKFVAYWLKKNKDLDINLILIPSIISVDAFLCSTIAVRVDNNVKYIGQSNPKQIIIDFDLIRKAPAYLNRAGVSDTISIASALGDWIIAKVEVNEKFDLGIFNKAKKIVEDLMNERNEIRELTEKGLTALVDGFYKEVALCEEWGNARPEEGSEHFLAYCLESITGEHYIHGNLIGMNILISLYLQEQYAEFSLEQIKEFLKDIQLNFTPESQNISYKDLEFALKKVKKYVIEEDLFYSIYNCPKLVLNSEKIEEILKFIKSI